MAKITPWTYPHHTLIVKNRISFTLTVWILIGIVIWVPIRYSENIFTIVLSQLIISLLLLWIIYIIKPDWNYNVEMARYIGASNIKRGTTETSWTEKYYIYPNPIKLIKNLFTTFSMALCTAPLPFSFWAAISISQFIKQRTAELWILILGKTLIILVLWLLIGSLSYLIMRYIGSLIICHYILKHNIQLEELGYTESWRVIA